MAHKDNKARTLVVSLVAGVFILPLCWGLMVIFLAALGGN